MDGISGLSLIRDQRFDGLLNVSESNSDAAIHAGLQQFGLQQLMRNNIGSLININSFRRPFDLLSRSTLDSPLQKDVKIERKGMLDASERIVYYLLYN